MRLLQAIFMVISQQELHTWKDVRKIDKKYNYYILWSCYTLYVQNQ